MGRSCNECKDCVEDYYNAENVSSAPSERQSRQACEKVKTTTLDRVRCSSAEMSSCTRREKSDREEMRGSCYEHQMMYSLHALQDVLLEISRTLTGQWGRLFRHNVQGCETVMQTYSIQTAIQIIQCMKVIHILSAKRFTSIHSLDH